MARVLFVRHATHDLIGKALAGRMAGVSLSALGRQEADRLVERIAATPVGRILCSPLQRCQETAAPVAARLGLPVETREALGEIDCGDWTGMSFEALAEDPRWHAWNDERGRTTIPGGESVHQVQARLMGLLESLSAAEGLPTLLVTHSDVIKVGILSLLGGALDWHDRLDIDPASITTVDLWPGGGKLVRSNETVPA